MVDRVPVYCDISTRIQVTLNVAIPACSLCINHRIYKIATMKAVVIEKRKTVIQDLLIGVGIPILQIIAQYTVSSNRYDIIEDFGPVFATALVPPTFVLFYAWPVAIGLVSLYYCVISTYSFYKRRCQLDQLMSFSQGLSLNQYLRLMAIGTIEVLGTIPLGTFLIVYNAKIGVTPWISWADTHSHYSEGFQIPSLIWKNDPEWAIGLEIFRWSLVVCAFVFFALIGFAEEARRHYRCVYTSLASRIGYTTFTVHGSSHATSSVPHVKSKGGITVSVVTKVGVEHRSSVPLANRPLVPSIFTASDIKPDLKFERYSPLNIPGLASSSMESFDKPRLQGQSTLPVGVMPAVPPASIPPRLPDTIKSTMRAHSGVDLNAV